MNKGKYAEYLNYIVEQIHSNNIKEIHLNYELISIEGLKREVDLFVITNDGDQIVYEVRNRASTQGVDWIDQVIGKYIHEEIDKYWIVTFDNCELSKDAIVKLSYHNIGWRNFVLLNKLNSKIPVVTMNTLLPVYTEMKISIDNEDYKDLMFDLQHNGIRETVSLERFLQMSLTNELKKNIEPLMNANHIDLDLDSLLASVGVGFDSEKPTSKIRIPLVQKTYTDYIDEYYIVDNDDEKYKLICSENKTVFVYNGTLMIDMKFISELNETKEISTSFLLNVNEIKKYVRDTKNIKAINTGPKDVSIMKVFGLNKK